MAVEEKLTASMLSWQETGVIFHFQSQDVGFKQNIGAEGLDISMFCV